MSRTGLDYGCESHNEHGKPERLDASPDALGAEVCVAGVAIRDDLARPSFSQATLVQRMAYTPDVLRLCSEFIPNADEITICLREKNAELSDACRMVFEAGMQQPPGVSGGTVARNRPAR
jgi:hypothetical protein